MQQDGDRGTFAHFALHFDVAVMQIHQLFGQVHTDTRSRTVGGIQLIVAGEALEEHVSFLRGDTDTFVLHAQRNKTRFVGNNNGDPFAGGGELECVAQQIPQDRVHSCAIHPYRRVFGMVHHLELNMFVVRLFAEIGARFFRQLAQKCLLHFEFHLLVLHFAELQQLVHHAQHALAVALNDLQLAADTLADTLRLENILHRSDDKRQRGAKFMADIGEETEFDIRYLLLNLHFLAQGIVNAYRINGRADQ